MSRYNWSMSSLTLEDIGLPASKLRAVARKAKRAGQATAEYVRFETGDLSSTF